MVESYDIIFYGAETKSNQLDDIKKRVAKILRLNDQKLEALFSRWGGVVLKHGVSLEGAEKAKKILTEAGALCFFRRNELSKNSLDNKLKNEAGFRWRLSKRHNILVSTAIATTAAVYFAVAGIPLPSTDVDHGDPSARDERLGSLSPIQGVSQPDSVTMPTNEFASSRHTTKQITDISETLSGSQMDSVKNTQVPQRMLFSFEKTHKIATQMLTEIADDREWSVSLASVIQTLLESDRLDHAYKIGGHIIDDTQRFRTLGDIAYHYASRGKKESATAKLNDLKKDITAYIDQPKQVFMLSELAILYKRTGNPVVGQQTLEEAQTLTNTIQSSLDKAIALGHIAAAQTMLSGERKADSTFQKANSLMSTVSGLKERLAGYIQLASSYSSAGDKNGTSNVLHAALKSTKKVSDRKDRSALLSEISLLNAQTGSHTAALDAAGIIEAPIDRDKIIYQLVTEQIAAGNLYAAMASAEKLEQPVYEAKAFALLARFQKGSHLNPLGNDNFEHAIDSASTLSDPVIQSIILSEIGRYHMRSEEEATARELMAMALGLATQADNLQNRDIAFAAIAKNQALASLLTQADRTAALIDSEPLKTRILNDISKIRRTIYALKVVQVPLNV